MADAELQDWQVRQSRTFSKWCNMYLAKKGYEPRVGEAKEFGESWTDGVTLMQLMNALYEVPMPRKYKKEAKTRVHRLDNVTQALKMVDKAEVKTTHLKQVNLLDGDFTMMCGMVWNVILDYNIKGISVEDKNAKTGLLLWCRKKTKDYKGINGEINNFTNDWSNGNAFLALVDKHTVNMVDYNGMYEKSAQEKLDEAFTACEKLGIPRLLEVDDLEVPDSKSVMTYVSEMFKLFSKEDIKDNARDHIGRFLKFQRRMDMKIGDYTRRYDEVMNWLRESNQRYTDMASESLASQTDCNMASDSFKEYILNEKPAKLAEVIDVLDLLSEIQGELKVNQRVAYVPDADHSPEGLQDAVVGLGQTENDYMTFVRGQRDQFLAKNDEAGVSDDRTEEFEKAYKVFDTDGSGTLSKDEYKAALSGVGVAMDDADFEENWASMASDGSITKEQFIEYLTNFFTTSDTAESVMKSLQVLGNPDAPTDDMFIGMSEEDTQYLTAMMSENDGSLAAAIAATFSED